MKSYIAPAVLVLSCGMALSASAQTVWSGAAGTTDWLAPQNWLPLGVPGFGAQLNASVLISPGSPTTVLLAETPETAQLTNFSVPSSQVTTILSGSFMDIRGDYLNAGTLLVDPGTFRSQLRIFGTSISGNGHGEISLFGGLNNPSRALLSIMNSASIASGMNIHGLGTVVGNFTNNGRIAADYPGQRLMVFPAQEGATIANRGLMTASGGGTLWFGVCVIENGGGIVSADASTVEFSASADLLGGTLATSNGGRIVMNATQSSSVYESGVHFAGDILTGETGVLRFNFDNLHPTIVNSGTIHVTKFTDSAAPAAVNLRYPVTFVGGGTLSFEGRTGRWAEARFNDQGVGVATNAAGHTFQGIGTLDVAVVNHGRLKVGFAGVAPNNDQRTVLQFNKPLTLGSGGSIEIALAAAEAGTPASGHLVASTPLTMAGTLRVVLEGSPLVAPVGRSWDLIEAPSLSGAFASIVTPDLPTGRRWATSLVRVGNADHLQLQILCGADFNNDGFVDFFDYDDFVNAFETGTAQADYNGDAFVDFFDYDDFVAAFEGGC